MCEFTEIDLRKLIFQELINLTNNIIKCLFTKKKNAKKNNSKTFLFKGIIEHNCFSINVFEFSFCQLFFLNICFCIL